MSNSYDNFVKDYLTKKIIIIEHSPDISIDIQ